MAKDTASLEANLSLRRFVEDAVASLASPVPRNVWGQLAPEQATHLDRASTSARRRLCAQARAFKEAGKADTFEKQDFADATRAYASHLLELAQLAWPAEWRSMGMRAEVSPEASQAWRDLKDRLKALLQGDAVSLATVCQAISTISEAALQQGDAQAIPNEALLPGTPATTPAIVEPAETTEAPAGDQAHGPASGDPGGAQAGQDGEAGADRDKLLRDMKRSVRLAYLAFEYAESKVGKHLRDREAHDLLTEEGIPDAAGGRGELTDYCPPAFTTWNRQLREARKALCEQKYTRRAGRPICRSIVRADQIEHQHDTDQ